MCFGYVNFMDLKLNETSEIWGSKEIDHKMADFLDLMSRDQLITMIMEAVGSSETFVYVYQRKDIAYQET